MLVGSTSTFGMDVQFPGQSIEYSENPTIPFGPTLTGWRSIGGAKLSLDTLHPLSDALTTVMRVDVPINATGEVGFLNEGISFS